MGNFSAALGLPSRISPALGPFPEIDPPLYGRVPPSCSLARTRIGMAPGLNSFPAAWPPHPNLKPSKSRHRPPILSKGRKTGSRKTRFYSIVFILSGGISPLIIGAHLRLRDHAAGGPDQMGGAGHRRGDAFLGLVSLALGGTDVARASYQPELGSRADALLVCEGRARYWYSRSSVTV